MARSQKQYTVREKEAHYNSIIAQADKKKKSAEKARREDNRVSYAAGYNQAVKDCRAQYANRKKK